ncbi:hypothetical protein ACN28S_59980 [Cystobacter fuscus]
MTPCAGGSTPSSTWTRMATAAPCPPPAGVRGRHPPPPYTPAASGNDCDDADSARFLWRVLYPDRDGDGVGTPPRVVLCLDDGPTPPGYSIYGFDPDDSDPASRDPADESELDEFLFTQ